MKDQEIFEALEQLGAAFPWESVDVWVRREPAGIINYTVYLNGAAEIGLESDFGHGKTVAEAVADAMKLKDRRDPAQTIKDKINRLKRDILKLEQVAQTLALPPFCPCLLLGVSNPVTEPEPAPPLRERPPAYINVESSKDEVPF